MIKKRILAIVILLLGVGIAFFVFSSEPKFNKNYETAPSFLKKFPFRLGLDLSGGSHLIYKADVSGVPEGQISDSMNALRDVIERRVNLFGIAEPIIQIQQSSFISGGEEKLIVDLPGISDLEKATEMIGQTPLLEFKTESGNTFDPEKAQEVSVDENGQIVLNMPEEFTNTELTGRYLKRASLEFDSTTRQPMVSLQFDDKGTELFAKITKENIGKRVAIYLDGAPLSTPVVREEIPNGQAVISGDFTPIEAKQLVGRLNSGALPVPITLISKQTIGATLGEGALNAGIKAALFGFFLIALFLIFWYRLPGVIAVISLSIYVILILTLFKLLPVTLTAAGIAGFIISIGIAVDANILIFERIKEEMRIGRTVADSVANGFSRAWFSIRDSNLSTIISALILYWFGTFLIKGFALTLGMGVLVSMLSAITISKIFLSAISFIGEGKVARFLFSSGLKK
jgi:preprotein translocase subunit SecD